MRGRTGHRTILGAFVAAAASLVSSGASAQTIVFADLYLPQDPPASAIKRVDVGGGNLATMIPTGGGLRGLDVDAAAGKVYWTDVDNFTIRRANLNGSSQQDLVLPGVVAFPVSLRLNLAAGKVLWGDATNEEIPRCNLDGTDFENPIGGTPVFRGLAIDNVNGKIYWTTSVAAATGQIRRANLDGTNPEVVVPIMGSFWKPTSLAIDPAGGKLYWTDSVGRFVRRSNLDGTGIEVLFDANFTGSPKGIAVHLPSGKVYWGQDINDPDSGGFMFGEIRRMNLNGTDQELVAAPFGAVNDLVVVPTLPPPAPCPADFDQMNGLTVADIFAFLTAWFANGIGADFNQMDGITVADIFAFLTAWFAGCQ